MAYWTANAYDAESHLTQSTAGNGIVTNKVYSLAIGRIVTIKSRPADSVQDLAFDFNTLGNLIERIDAVAGLTDTLDDDDLNRLTKVVTSNPNLLGATALQRV